MVEEGRLMHRTGIGLIIALLLTLAGCKSIGPLTISRDRFDYNAAISDSWKSQMLLNMVKLRYGDAPVFLEVDSVNGQYELGLDLTFGFSWSPGTDKQDFSGAGSYKDKPIIVYKPMTGDKFAKNLMTPLSPFMVLGLVQAGFPVDVAMRSCLNSINNIQNRYSGLSYSHPADPKFDPLCEKLRKLQEAGGMSIMLKRSEKKDKKTEKKEIVEDISMSFTKKADPDLKKEIQNDLELGDVRIGCPMRVDSQGEVAKPNDTPTPNKTPNPIEDPKPNGTLESNGTPTPNGTPPPCPTIVILPRSFLEIAINLASGIDVPEEHIKDDRVKRSENVTEKSEDQLIRVKVALKKPRDVFVEVWYHNYWFWIDDRDLRSKTMFSFLLYVFSLNEVEKKAGTPILTIPVG